MLGSGQVPKLTYTNTTYIKLPPKAGTELDTTNKTNVDGLGHMTHREEVASQDNETGTRLEVTVSHNNWDAVQNTSSQVPKTSSKLTPYTSVISGHLAGRSNPSTTSSSNPSPRAGRNFVTFNKPSTSSSTPDSTPFPTKAPFSKVLAWKTQQEAQASLVKGKQRAVKTDSSNRNPNAKADEAHESADNTPPKPPKKGCGQPKKDDLVQAAKKMKRA
ncbi:hypothetical protein PCANC_28236 [Puccinia coronata f. sp. avenae]|uniref:Uncharacterized protein n=1 Tax=Puccinia coronata f. sp. avenae TaxID=200324 RepID=A0A2N5TL31_9BASI|nr:hypothetical protein PCANC_28236 [Puccinia coronata f. sp. avenae]